MANSPYGCHIAGTNTAAVAYAKVIIFAHGQNQYTWSLKAIRPIPRGQEILLNYGPAYQFPNHYGPALL